MRERVLAAYFDDRSGSVAIISALTAIIIFALAGGATDYARWVYSRNQMQAALDAAVLAGGRHLQISSGNESAALDAAMSTYRSMRSKYIASEDISFRITNSGLNFQAVGNAIVTTPFMSVVGVPDLPVFEKTQNVRAEAMWSVGSNSETSIEMSLMLDTTGSMTGQKIKDLREAAAELIEIVVWDDQSRSTSKLALAPFSSSVQVGDLITGLIDPALALVAKNIVAQCVVERTGVAALTDAAPGVGAWLTSYNVAINSGASSCPEDVMIEPLTSDKARLKNAVASLAAQGSTAGALGTAWAWYLLSPNWSDIWTGTSAPAPYSRLTETTAGGAPKLQKIAVLMTDGTYNTYQAGMYSDSSKQAKEISGKAVSLCTGMKEKGIIVYSVGFQLANDLAKDTLRSCATSPAHFYDAKDGEALRVAFRDIAVKSTPLRLSH